MIIVKEASKKKNSLQEATPVAIEDVIGLSGFKAYTIHGLKLYVENFHVLGSASLVRGPGSLSPQDVSLVTGSRAVVSIPVKNIKSIGMKRLNVAFFLDDGTVVEFMR